MAITRSRRPIGTRRLAATARRLLDASTLCAVATAGQDGHAHINTAYFAWSAEFELVWLSEPQARHSRNIRANAATAVAVYDSSQTWGEPDRGIQLFGRANEATEPAAESVYRGRFPDFAARDFDGLRFYIFQPRRLKLFDERQLGAGTFVTARLARGRLVWERTEIYTNTRS